MRNSFRARHPRRLRRVRVQLPATDDAQAVRLPIGFSAAIDVAHDSLPMKIELYRPTSAISPESENFGEPLDSAPGLQIAMISLR
jgi:hypothetical protein